MIESENSLSSAKRKPIVYSDAKTKKEDVCFYRILHDDDVFVDVG
jgi:hypothetical protein